MTMIEEYGPPCPQPAAFERGTDGPRVIMVGVDGTPTAMRAASYAYGLARRQQSRLVVAYVACPNGFSNAISGAAALAQEAAFNELTDELRTEAKRFAEEFRIPVTFIPRRGDAYTELRTTADQVKADMVVVGASTTAGHRLIGSIATRLVKLGHWPVVVVP